VRPLLQPSKSLAIHHSLMSYISTLCGLDTDDVRFDVLTAVVIKSSVFWDITLCSPLKFNRRFGGTCRLHFHSRRISQARNQREAGGRLCFLDTDNFVK
jgi:hypothetical protein